MYTEAVEDYLKTIYEIQCKQGQVATTTLADRLGVAPASVTNMVKRLADMHLVTHEPYHGVLLTERGKKIALEVIRHHRLVESYLVEALGMPWDQVHAEAERWEHVLSEELETRMDAILNYPTTDPHGAPIPTQEGTVAPSAQDRLADLEPGQSAVVAQVSDHNPELLRYLGGLGLYPGAEVHMVTTAPFDGPLTIRVGEAEHGLGRQAASHVLVTQIRTEEANS